MQDLTHTAQRTLKFCRENRLEIAPHPPYSPDLAPSDFFLFGHVKHALEGDEFSSEEAFLAAIHSVSSNLTGDTLRAIFVQWIERLNWVALNESIIIDSLSICIFSFVSFSSVAVMLIPPGTPYTFFCLDDSR
jgi:hypothetical protein